MAINKEKVKQQKRNYYLKNRGKILAHIKEYTIKNRDKVLARKKIYCLKHREEKRIYDKAYRERNREKKILADRAYYKKNKDRAFLVNKKYRLLNAEKLKISAKIYLKSHLKEINAQRSEHFKKKWKIDFQYRLRRILRNRLFYAIKGKNAGIRAGSAVRDLGCTIPELVIHLEKQFKPGMTWENWSYRGWHIDHKTPLDSFDLTKPEQVKMACHFTNLQPMWALDNIKKHNKII